MACTGGPEGVWVDMQEAMTEEQLISAAHRSYVDAFRKLAEHCPNGAVRDVGGGPLPS